MSQSITIALVSAISIAFFCVVTRPKDPSTETNTIFFIKVLVIAFVCSYASHVFISNVSSPVLDLGEPDF